eukprot:gb/GECG01016774.1/.p1 GENE.gb/GECG01016774.1/~~gb/GECG01016774.1/.p1  ORF type:complete len:1139 (+),score=161.45 gb/GECG01016774.1/:1-3417(+)
MSSSNQFPGDDMDPFDYNESAVENDALSRARYLAAYKQRAHYQRRTSHVSSSTSEGDHEEGEERGKAPGSPVHEQRGGRGAPHVASPDVAPTAAQARKFIDACDISRTTSKEEPWHTGGSPTNRRRLPSASSNQQTFDNEVEAQNEAGNWALPPLAGSNKSTKSDHEMQQNGVASVASTTNAQYGVSTANGGDEMEKAAFLLHGDVHDNHVQTGSNQEDTPTEILRSLSAPMSYESKIARASEELESTTARDGSKPFEETKQATSVAEAGNSQESATTSTVSHSKIYEGVPRPVAEAAEAAKKDIHPPVGPAINQPPRTLDHAANVGNVKELKHHYGPPVEVGHTTKAERAPSLEGEQVAPAAKTAAQCTQDSRGGVVCYNDDEVSDEFSASQDDWLPVEMEHAFQRVQISGKAKFTEEQREVCRALMRAMFLRRKYVYRKPDHYWGAFSPDEFSPEHFVSPGDARWQQFQYEDSAPPAQDEDQVLAEHPHPELFFRRRPEIPFNVVENSQSRTPGPANYTYRMEKGVIHAYEVKPKNYESISSLLSEKRGDEQGEADGLLKDEIERLVDEGHCEVGEAQYVPHDFLEFQKDYMEVVRTVHLAPVKSFAWKRLKLLESRFKLHCLLNGELESAESKAVPHRDFYNVRKVDTHVHHSACMTQKHLLRFIKHKLKRYPHEKVIIRDGKELSLTEVFDSLNLTAYDLSIDTLDMHADNTFHRFDRFNLKYNPIGQSRLREIFLKTDNHIEGRYLGEVTKQVLDDLESSKYQLAEYRLSVYGRRRNEWSRLAKWFVRNHLYSSNVRWMIQIPRLYEVYKSSGLINTFQDMLDNIFLPLWHVSVDPSCDPDLHHFLTLVVGFDCVDDESKQEAARDAQVPPPDEWDLNHPPPYYYWVYYLATNLKTLNIFRAKRGLTTFSFRPHSGEAGEVDHLVATFLYAESVNHGITMSKNPPLQYLYYLMQIGLAMSPLSNNKLFVDYNRNPFYQYFARGLNVSLSTDDPLLLHYTREPLVEEYCVAAQVWKLNSVDLCEIARNSVLQSGFEHPYRAHFIGPNYATPGPRGNDIYMTNVPDIRLQFRLETLMGEHSIVQQGAITDPCPPMEPMALHPPVTVMKERAKRLKRGQRQIANREEEDGVQNKHK